MNNTVKVKAGQTQFVAHRGVSGLERENTCAAFIAAGNRSYLGMETDIYRTADGKFILNHDGNLKRIAGDMINVEEATYDTLRSIRLTDLDGSRHRADLHLADLEDYLSICRHYEKTCVLELKSAFTDEEICEILARIEAFEYLSHVIFISFGYENLVKIRAQRPEQPCQFLTGDASDAMIEKLAADHFDIDIHYPSLTEERIAAFHAKGILVNCWTVDSREDAERLISWGVDQITTNILEGC